MIEEFLEAWRTNNRINLYLIEQISRDGMRCSLSTHGGRDVALQFAHMHNVRVWQMEKRAKDLARGMTKFESKVSPSKAALSTALKASGKMIETFFTDLSEGKAKRRGFKKGIPTVLAYFVAHESHHRGSILLTLKGCGHKLSTAGGYAIWDWDRL
jgi:uncharacterized damage-inducible protein DinB